MTGLCCLGSRGSGWRRFVRRFSGAVPPVLSGAVLVLLPKCPLCLAAWLAGVTGVGFQAAAAAGMRGIVLMVWMATMLLAAAAFLRRRLQRRRRT